MADVLSELVSMLRSGALRVVDLTQPLSPQTPLLPLPPQWPNTPAFRMWEISRYDERGPAWYWNGFETGEHTGTHFDAPVHWVSGKDLPDNTVDTIPVGKFVGPACVIDVTAEAESDPDFLLTVDRVERWESAAWPHSRGCVVPAADGMVAPHRRRGLHQFERGRPAHAWLRQGMLGDAGARSRCARRGCGDRRYRTPAAPPASTRRFPITAPCMATASSVSPDCATWISCRQRARL